MPEISRRGAIALGAVAPLVASCGGSESISSRRVAVIGAGIVGASIAYHLAKSGARVTVLDRYEIATRASRGTFAWLNATWAKQPRDYHRLNQLGLAGWQELERELSIPIKWGGSIEWFDSAERQAKLVEQIAEQVEWREPARIVAREELAKLEPKVEFDGVETAAFSPNDGALDPVMAARRMLDAAMETGAELMTDCPVTSVKTESDGTTVLDTAKGAIETETFVLATGADPDALKALGKIDIPQRSTPGVIVVTKPFEPVLNRVLVAPGVHIHQRLDGRIVLGEQDGAPDNAAHAQRLAGRPTAFPTSDVAEQHAARIMAVAERFVPEISKAATEDVYIGWRPLPLDGHPVMGFSPNRTNAYIAVAHSGVSLAPILGRLAASEILEGGEAEILAPYRPSRSFAEIRRY